MGRATGWLRRQWRDHPPRIAFAFTAVCLAASWVAADPGARWLPAAAITVTVLGCAAAAWDVHRR